MPPESEEDYRERRRLKGYIGDAIEDDAYDWAYRLRDVLTLDQLRTFCDDNCLPPLPDPEDEEDPS